MVHCTGDKLFGVNFLIKKVSVIPLLMLMSNIRSLKTRMKEDAICAGISGHNDEIFFHQTLERDRIQAWRTATIMRF